MEVYHTSAATPASFNPYLPTIGRILEVLLSYAPAGTAIQICNRDLARAVGLRSAGSIPALLRRMEAHKRIERITTPQGSLVVVLGDHGFTDRIAEASGCDQSIADRSAAETPNAPRDRSRMADRPKNPLYGTQKNHDQQQESARTSVFDGSQDTPIYQHLMTKPDMNPGLARKIAGRPIGTIADFETDLAIANTIPSITTPLFFTAALWRDGQRVHAPEEHTDDRSGRGDRGDRGTHRPESRPSGGDRRPGARGGTAGGARRSGPTRDTYGVGAAFRDRPDECDLPPFLRAAAERARLDAADASS